MATCQVHVHEYMNEYMNEYLNDKENEKTICEEGLNESNVKHIF